jgi:hypothetical protein
MRSTGNAPRQKSVRNPIVPLKSGLRWALQSSAICNREDCSATRWPVFVAGYREKYCLAAVAATTSNAHVTTVLRFLPVESGERDATPPEPQVGAYRSLAIGRRFCAECSDRDQQPVRRKRR